VDTDTRLQLLRVEDQPSFDHEPVFSAQLGSGLTQLVNERRNPAALIDAGLHK
jgi:hypothetical protein